MSQKIQAPVVYLQLSGVGVKPQIPDPITLVSGEEGFDDNKHLMVSQWAYNGTDNIWYYRGVSKIYQVKFATQTIDPGTEGDNIGNIEVWSNQKPYTAGNVYVSYTSTSPGFQNETIYRCKIDTLEGESPESHPDKWEKQGEEFVETVIEIKDVRNLESTLNNIQSSLNITRFGLLTPRASEGSKHITLLTAPRFDAIYIDPISTFQVYCNDIIAVYKEGTTEYVKPFVNNRIDFTESGFYAIRIHFDTNDLNQSVIESVKLETLQSDLPDYTLYVVKADIGNEQYCEVYDLTAQFLTTPIPDNNSLAITTFKGKAYNPRLSYIGTLLNSVMERKVQLDTYNIFPHVEEFTATSVEITLKKEDGTSLPVVTATSHEGSHVVDTSSTIHASYSAVVPMVITLFVRTRVHSSSLYSQPKPTIVSSQIDVTCQRFGQAGIAPDIDFDWSNTDQEFYDFITPLKSFVVTNLANKLGTTLIKDVDVEVYDWPNVGKQSDASVTSDPRGNVYSVTREFTNAELLAGTHTIDLVPGKIGIYYDLVDAFLVKTGTWSSVFSGGDTISVIANTHSTATEPVINFLAETVTGSTSTSYLYKGKHENIKGRIAVNKPIRFLFSNYTGGTGQLKLTVYYREIPF